MSSYSRVTSHKAMVFDEVRNRAYARAIQARVQRGSVALDLGAGLGIHGLIAAAAGARAIYMVDPSPVVLAAEQIAEANGFSQQVSCFRSEIEQTQLPEKADLLLSVFTGNFLLTEDLLPALFWARDHCLAPGGRMIPDRARMWVAPVSADEYYREHIEAWSEPVEGINFGKARLFASNSLFYDKQERLKAVLLADPVCIEDIDLTTATNADCDAEAELTLGASGTCHGWLGWMDIRLGDYWLSTAPDAADTHWSQTFLPLDVPLGVKAGQVLRFGLSRPEYGEWTWTTTCGDLTQRQSTFLSLPLEPASLAKRSPEYRPTKGDLGRAALSVLVAMEGELRTAEIAQMLCKDHPDLFSVPAKAARFVDDMIRKFG